MWTGADGSVWGVVVKITVMHEAKRYISGVSNMEDKIRGKGKREGQLGGVSEAVRTSTK